MREKYHLPLVKTGDWLKSVPSLSVPHHLKYHEDSVPLKRVKTLHPHPCLKHIALRMTLEMEIEYGGRIMFLKEAEGFVCKGSDPLSYLYTANR